MVVTNHSAGSRKATCRAVLPQAWNGKTTDWTGIEIPAKTDGQAKLAFDVPADAKAGRYVIPVDLKYDKWNLPQFTEAVVVIPAI